MQHPASSPADLDPQSPERRRLVQQIVDRTLMEGVARGDRASIDSLVHRFAGRLRGFFLARGVSPGESLQLTRRALQVAVGAAAEFDGLSGLPIWLRRFAAQGLAQWETQTATAVRRHRARYRRPARHQLAAHGASGSLATDWTELCREVDRIGFVTPHADVEPREIMAALQRLPRPQREVLLAYYGRLESVEGISQLVRRGEVAVRHLLDQGLQQIWAQKIGAQKSGAQARPSGPDAVTADVPPLRHNHPAFSGFDPATLKPSGEASQTWDFQRLPPEEWANFADWLALEEVLYQGCAPNPLQPADVLGHRLVEPLRRTVWPWRAAIVLVPLLLAALLMKEWPAGGMVPIWFRSSHQSTLAQVDSAGDSLGTAASRAKQSGEANRSADDDAAERPANDPRARGSSSVEQAQTANGLASAAERAAGEPGKAPASTSQSSSTAREFEKDTSGKDTGANNVAVNAAASGNEATSDAATNDGAAGDAATDDSGASQGDRSAGAQGAGGPSSSIAGEVITLQPPAANSVTSQPTRPRPTEGPAIPPARRPVEDLVAWRAELYRLVYARDWVALRQWCSQLEFTGSAAERQWGKNLSRWGATVAQVEGNPESLAMTDTSWSLLGRSYDRRTYEAIQEYYAALEAEAVVDFEKLHRRLTAQQFPGLAPWPGDAEQLVTVWGASQLAGQWLSREDKMSAEDRAAARIHVARSLRGATVEQAWELARLYEGTAAAGRVYEWLGQQELQALRLADAQGLIRRAAAVDPAHATRWQAWLNQLAAVPVSSGNATMVAEERENRGAAGESVWQADWGPPEIFPQEWLVERSPPAAASAVLHVTAGTKMPISPWQPETELATELRRKETAGVLEPVVAARRVGFWSNREGNGLGAPSTPAASDPSAGENAAAPGTRAATIVWQTADQLLAWDGQAQRPLWQYAAPAVPGRANERTPPVAGFRPVLDEDRVVSTLGPHGYCHAVDTGEILWRTDLPLGTALVSSPVVRADRYAWVATVKTNQGTEVRLIHIDPFSGVVLAEYPLFMLRSVWRPLERCELAESGEMLVGVWRGLSSGFDIYGHVYWVRESITVPPQLDPGLSKLDLQSPLLSDRYAWIWQPGVPTVECVELRSGRRVWRKVWTDLQRFVGSAEDTLVYARSNEMLALSQATGEIKWRKPLRAEWGPAGWSDVAGRAWVWTQSAEAQPGPKTWVAHWLDLATGKFLGSWQLRFPAEAPATLGPLVAHQGRFWLLTCRRDAQTWNVWPLTVRRSSDKGAEHPLSTREELRDTLLRGSSMPATSRISSRLAASVPSAELAGLTASANREGGE